MPSLRDLKRRIKSVSGIRQITRAMEMVSATKLRRAQSRIETARPYCNKMEEILAHLREAVYSESFEHPLLIPHKKINRALIISTASDKGLCGSYNANVIREVEKHASRFRQNNIDVELLLIGKKLIDYFKRREWIIRPESENFKYIDQQLPVSLLQQITDLASSLLLSGWINQVELVYTQFITAISHRIISKQLFPITSLTSDSKTDYKPGKVRDYIFEPNAQELLQALIPKYARTIILEMLADSIASEHGARMSAMHNATDNAADMISTLTLQMNKARQAAITKELSEIVGGAEALTGQS